MALKTNSAEGYANGATVTAGTSGGTSGDQFTGFSVTGTATLTASTAQKAHGSVSYRVQAPATTDTAIFGWTGYNDATFAFRFYIRFNSLPGAFARIFSVRRTGGNAMSVTTTTTNKFSVQDSTGSGLVTFATAFTTGTWYRIEGEGSFTASTLNVRTYALDSNTPRDTAYTGTGVSLGGNCTEARFGKVDNSGTSTLDAWMDDVAFNNGSTSPIGPVGGVGPTASFTKTSIGTDGIFDASASTATSPATISSYAWTFGDSGTGTGVNPTHKYATGGTYTVGLTVTDSNGATASTSSSITITAPGSTGTVRAIRSAAGWTAAPSGTVLANLSDVTGGSPVLSTFIVSSTSPTAQALELDLEPISPPASGQPLVVTLYVDRISSSSGSLAAQIYEGATQRASLTGVSIPDASSTGGTGDATSGAVGATAAVVLTFPWSSVQNITDWNQLILKMQFTAA